MTNKRYGRLLVLNHTRTTKGKPYWLVRCDCGTQKEVMGETMRYGKAKSCGCWKREMIGLIARKHGMTASHFWYKWRSLKQRCLDKNSSTYYKYGARGVGLCKEWMDFENFKRDMYTSYKKHVEKYGERETTLDRIDVYGNYEPSNVRWATHKQQGRNKTNNAYLTMGGKKKTIAEWSEITGIPRSILEWRRTQPNWTDERALTQIPRKQKNSNYFKSARDRLKDLI